MTKDSPTPQPGNEKNPQPDSSDAESSELNSRRLDDTLSTPDSHSFLSGDLPLPEKIGPYKIISQIGEGGMGVVYRAKEIGDSGLEVALKVIKSNHYSEEVLSRFHAERKALALMAHPHIAQLYHTSQLEDGTPYFAMEYVQGKALTDYCDEKRLSTEERLQLFCKICEAIQHAHQKGIIHRDLKPSNILVKTVDGEAYPVIIDFGIAKALEGSYIIKDFETLVGQPVGTLDYMSPEQALGEQAMVGTGSDVYALGVILYELLVGQRPHDIQSLRENLKQNVIVEFQRYIREQEPKRPSTRLSTSSALDRNNALLRRTNPGTLAKKIRGDLDWITLKAMSKRVQDRYKNVSDLHSEILRHLRDEPVFAGPPAWSTNAIKAWRRNRVAWSSAALLLFCFLIWPIVVTTQYWQKHKQEQLVRDQNYNLSIFSASSAIKHGDGKHALELLAQTEAEKRGPEFNYLTYKAKSYHWASKGIARAAYKLNADLSQLSMHLGSELVRLDLATPSRSQRQIVKLPKEEQIRTLIGDYALIQKLNHRPGDHFDSFRIAKISGQSDLSGEAAIASFTPNAADMKSAPSNFMVDRASELLVASWAPHDPASYSEAIVWYSENTNLHKLEEKDRVRGLPNAWKYARIGSKAQVLTAENNLQHYKITAGQAELLSTTVLDETRIAGISLSADGNIAAVLTQNTAYLLAYLEEDQLWKKLYSVPAYRCQGISLAPDATALAIADGHKIEIYQFNFKEEFKRSPKKLTFSSSNSPIRKLFFRSTKELISAQEDGQIQSWTLTPPIQIDGHITQINLCANGQGVFYAKRGQSDKVMIYGQGLTASATAMPLKSYEEKMHFTSIASLGLESATVACLHDTYALHYWPKGLQSDQAKLLNLPANSLDKARIRKLAIDPKAKRLVVLVQPEYGFQKPVIGREEGHYHLFDLDNLSHMGSLKIQIGYIRKIIWQPSSKHFAAIGKDGVEIIREDLGLRRDMLQKGGYTNFCWGAKGELIALSNNSEVSICKSDDFQLLVKKQIADRKQVELIIDNLSNMPSLNRLWAFDNSGIIRCYRLTDLTLLSEQQTSFSATHTHYNPADRKLWIIENFNLIWNEKL